MTSAINGVGEKNKEKKRDLGRDFLRKSWEAKSLFSKERFQCTEFGY